MTAQTQPKSTFDTLMALTSGRLTCAMLEVAIDLDIFAKLKGRDLSLAEAGAAWGLPAPSVRVLAQYLCGLDLLRYREGRLSNAPLADTLVDDPSSLNVLRLVLKWDSSTGTIRKKLEAPPPLVWYQMRDQGEEPDVKPISMDHFYRGMHQIRIRWGEELASRYDFGNHRVLLDVGGASGGWCVGVRKHFPHLQCILFDIPPACQSARQILAETGDAQHIRIATGNFFTEALPTGADVALLANVLHDWTAEDGRKILRRVHAALPAGGVLLVWEFYLGDDWSGDVGPAGHAFSVLGAEGKGGWQPAYGEMEALLREEGFAGVERRPNLVIGKKPTR